MTSLFAFSTSFLQSTGAELFKTEFAPFIYIAALVICLGTLVNTNFGLSILIFSMLLSPEIEVAQLPERAVTLRVDDFLIVVVFFTWLAKMAIQKEIGLLRRSILNRAILLYIASFVFSTLYALQQGDLRGGLGGYFFSLKYIQFFLIFFMFFNNVRNKEQVQKFLVCFLITGLIVYPFALSQVGKYARVGAPFEGDRPEPGSLGGYLLVQIATFLGLLLFSDWPKNRIILFGILIFAVITLIFSTSRAALIALAPLYLMAIFLTPQKRTFLVVAFLAACLFGYLLIPPRVIQWTLQAFSASAGGKVYSVGGRHLELGPSGVARVESTNFVLSLWRVKPIFGYGVCGVGIVDSQFVRTLGEAGIVGLMVLLWLLFLVFRVGFRGYQSKDPFTKGLGAAVVLANTGLMVQALSANSYIIVRIMEPFWFLVAITLGLTQLEEEALEEKGKLKVA